MDEQKIEEFLKNFLKDLKEAQKRWCSDCVDDPEEMNEEYPDWIDTLVPKIEDLLGIPNSGLKIIHADYGSDNNFRDVTKILQENCYYNSLQLTVNNYTMKCDPSPGAAKRLEVTYTYNGVEKKETIPEGQTLNIEVNDE
jgi:hypothetical protein